MDDAIYDDHIAVDWNRVHRLRHNSQCEKVSGSIFCSGYFFQMLFFSYRIDTHRSLVDAIYRKRPIRLIVMHE